jgi:23S rRNA-/tRNA-specific pseudouridylate synthase
MTVAMDMDKTNAKAAAAAAAAAVGEGEHGVVDVTNTEVPSSNPSSSVTATADTAEAGNPCEMTVQPDNEQQPDSSSKSSSLRGYQRRSQRRNRKRPRSIMSTLLQNRTSTSNNDNDCDNEQLQHEEAKTDQNLPPVSIVPLPAGIPGWIRVVHPYPYTFVSYAKARWVGRTVLDVYTHEFGLFPSSYYELAIRQGRILVSDRPVLDTSYQIQASDVLSHTVHRHEPAVAISQPQTPPYLNKVGETQDLVAYDKPSTMPVHPCGGYHQNSLMNILELERQPPTLPQKLYTIHRLDRLTSGLVVLAKNPTAAKEWGRAIQQRRECEKLYLARVRGKFGTNISSADSNKIPMIGKDGRFPLHGEWINDSTDFSNADNTNSSDPSVVLRQRNAYGYWWMDTVGEWKEQGPGNETTDTTERTVDEWIQSLNQSSSNQKSDYIVSEPFVWFHFVAPVRIEDPKIGVCQCCTFPDLDPAAYVKTVKPAHTAFAIVRYIAHNDTTLLLVRPFTGRTHQIRIHLRHLNHPIANDPNYGGTMWFGNPIGQAASEQARQTLDAEGTDAALVMADQPATENEVKKTMANDNNDNHTSILRNSTDDGDEPSESLQQFIERTCVWCNRNKGKTIEERALLEFLVRSPGLWLHALQYTVKSITFRTELPHWAN